MKKLITDYSFDPTTKIITLLSSDILPLKQEQLLLITNITKEKILYNPFASGYGGILSGAFLLLECTLTDMLSTDKLQIFVDVVSDDRAEELFPLDRQFVEDINMQQVFGSNRLVDDNGRVSAKVIQPVLREKIGKLNATGQVVKIDCTDSTQILIQLNTFAGAAAPSNITIQFEATVDGAVWYVVDAFCINLINYRWSTYWASGSHGTSDTLWKLPTAGYKAMQCRVTGYSAGLMNVYMQALTTPWVPPSVNARMAYNNDLYTTDGNIAANIQDSPLTSLTRRDGVNPSFVAAPTVNQSNPSSFAMPVFWKYPQRFSRLRVQSGGDQYLPFAQQEHTNEIKVVYPDLYRLMEELLLHMKMLNINFANINNLPIPKGMESEIR